jgi:hypothetical protein
MLLAVGELNERRESNVFSALYSWKNPTTILRMMTAVITPPSINDPIPKLTAMAMMRTCKRIRKSVFLEMGRG